MQNLVIINNEINIIFFSNNLINLLNIKLFRITKKSLIKYIKLNKKNAQLK